jgi:APA family basic amino acid/polyamine antiporter
VIAPLGMTACVFVMVGLPWAAWERFFIWLAIGTAIYFAYGYGHSKLRGV